MSYSFLDSDSIKAIHDCNTYLEGFFKDKLGNEYNEDVSEKIGEDMNSKDIRNFYYYSLYCWRIFYYSFERDESNLESTVGKYIRLMGDSNVFINRDLAENDLPKLTFNIAKLVIIHYIYGGAIGSVVNEQRARYVENFHKIQDYAPYISSVLRSRGSSVDFNLISRALEFMVVRDFVKDLNVREVSDIIRKVNENEVNLSDMLEKQSELKKEIYDIEKRLEGYKGEYNFVELSSAFTKIRASKEKERSKSTRNYWVCMLTLMAFPVFAIWSHWGKTNFEWGELFVYIPMVTLEILFLYFMRIFYVETKNINSQILQIDLRLSLCEFIQGYVRYRKENSDSDDVLKSFETLIFSPIQASGENIPSVLDGANVLAELAGNILKAKER